MGRDLPEIGQRGGRAQNGVAAEIGVWDGQSSCRILDTGVPVALHLIDPRMHLPDAGLDRVCIDGDHNDPFIGRDIALWPAKVKPGGIIAGDDFNGQAGQSGAPVRLAVERAVAELGAGASLRLIANQLMVPLARTS